MIYEAFCEKFGFMASKTFISQLPVCEQYFTEQTDIKTVLKTCLGKIYDIARDDQNLRVCLKDGRIDQQAFDHLRKTYPLRREWSAHGGPQA